jgi:hypothetical protein
MSQGLPRFDHGGQAADAPSESATIGAKEHVGGTTIGDHSTREGLAKNSDGRYRARRKEVCARLNRDAGVWEAWHPAIRWRNEKSSRSSGACEGSEDVAHQGANDVARHGANDVAR